MVKEREWECGSGERGRQRTESLAEFSGIHGKKRLNRVVQTSNTVRCFDSLLVYGVLNKVFLHLLSWKVHLTIDSLLLCSYFNILDT